jgi:hypothetical protein
MKDIYEILRQKELDLSRLRKEVEALRAAANLPLAIDADDHNQPTLSNSPQQQPIEDLPANDHSRQAHASAWGERAKHWLGRYAA